MCPRLELEVIAVQTQRAAPFIESRIGDVPDACLGLGRFRRHADGSGIAVRAREAEQLQRQRDVVQALDAQAAHRMLQHVANLIVDMRADDRGSRRCHADQPRRDVDAVAIDFAIPARNVTQMHARAREEFFAHVGPCVALCQLVQHLQAKANGVKRAVENREHAVAEEANLLALARGQRGPRNAPKLEYSGLGLLLAKLHESAVADHIEKNDGREAALGVRRGIGGVGTAGLPRFTWRGFRRRYGTICAHRSRDAIMAGPSPCPHADHTPRPRR